MSRIGFLNSFNQLKSQPFFFFFYLRSSFVKIEISVLKLSPVITFSIEFVSLSTIKSNPVDSSFFICPIYKKSSYFLNLNAHEYEFVAALGITVWLWQGGQEIGCILSGVRVAKAFAFCN